LEQIFWECAQEERREAAKRRNNPNLSFDILLRSDKQRIFDLFLENREALAVLHEHIFPNLLR
jgi:hypothetical protein